MILVAAQYRAALLAMGKIRPQFVVPPPEFVVWLCEQQIPAELIDFLVSNALATELPFQSGAGGMWTPRDIIALNDQESAILAAGLLAVGNTTNGDFIVINLAAGVDEVGFVSHDELWDPTNHQKNMADMYAPVDRSIDALLTGMTAEETRWRTLPNYGSEQIHYPIDFCSALERRARRD